MIMKIDLIAIEYSDGKREMSLAVIDDVDKTKDRLLGPVPYDGAISKLAPMLVEAMPDFTLSVAIDHLTLIHFRNVMAHENSAGQSYPWKV